MLPHRLLRRLALGFTFTACAANVAAHPVPIPGEVRQAAEAHIKAKSYQNLGVNVVKPPQGEVTFVKFCMPSVGRQLWAVDLKLSAILPCGNIGVYQRNGKTEVSMLHPAYMTALYTDAAVANAGVTAEPLLMEMLDEVTGVRRP